MTRRALAAALIAATIAAASALGPPRTAEAGRTGPASGARPRRHAAAQRLADRSGREAPPGRRPAAVDRALARRPIRARREQRLREAHADGRGPEALRRARPRPARERVARARVAPGREARLRVRRLRERRVRAELANRHEAEDRGDDPDRAEGEGHVRRRDRDPSRRPPALRGQPARADARGGRPGDASRREDRPARRGALYVPRLARRPHALRLVVGRRARAALRPRDARAPRGGRDGRAPGRDGGVPGRLAPLRRVRQHERGLGDRRRLAPRRRADRHVALPAGAPGLDAERSRAVRRRPDAARRQRGQQHGGGRRRGEAGARRLAGLDPDRLVPDGGRVLARREADPRPLGQGAGLAGEPARAAARRPRRRGVRGGDPHGNALGPRRAGRDGRSRSTPRGRFV